MIYAIAPPIAVVVRSQPDVSLASNRGGKDDLRRQLLRRAVDVRHECSRSVDLTIVVRAYIVLPRAADIPEATNLVIPKPNEIRVDIVAKETTRLLTLAIRDADLQQSQVVGTISIGKRA